MMRSFFLILVFSFSLHAQTPCLVKDNNKKMELIKEVSGESEVRELAKLLAEARANPSETRKVYAFVKQSFALDFDTEVFKSDEIKKSFEHYKKINQSYKARFYQLQIYLSELKASEMDKESYDEIFDNEYFKKAKEKIAKNCQALVEYEKIHNLKSASPSLQGAAPELKNEDRHSPSLKTPLPGSEPKSEKGGQVPK